VFTQAGVSQKQAVPVHGACLVSGTLFEQQKLPVSPPQPAVQVKPLPQSAGAEHGTGSCAKHWRPVQQLASVVHDCESPEQTGGGGPHTPLLQASVALQQGIVPEQAWFVSAQVGGAAGAVHVPCVAPGGMAQVFGVQQSAFTVQEPPAGRHVFPPGVAQCPVPSQNAEQHCALEVHVAPSATHAPHTTPSKQYPVQHSSPVVQAEPGSLQVFDGGAVRQRFGPSGTVRHESPLQHSVSSVQVSPIGLQVPFVSAHRRTPFWSGTHGTPLQH
jgi:hypothetical protein